jgi:hypothetical protein
VAAGTSRGSDLEDGFIANCVAKSTPEVERGNDPLINVAECDRVNIAMSEMLSSSVNRDAAHKRELGGKYMRGELPAGYPISRPKSDPSDPKSLRKTDVSALVEQVVSLSELQRRRLYEVLVKYLSHMTTKPGRCNLLSYKFQVATDKSIVGYSRRIPFAL